MGIKRPTVELHKRVKNKKINQRSGTTHERKKRKKNLEMTNKARVASKNSYLYIKKKKKTSVTFLHDKMSVRKSRCRQQKIIQLYKAFAEAGVYRER